jgi:hypothetical protein
MVRRPVMKMSKAPKKEMMPKDDLTKKSQSK